MYKTYTEALYAFLDKVLNKEPDYNIILNDIDGTYIDIDYLKKQFDKQLCESKSGYYFTWEQED